MSGPSDRLSRYTPAIFACAFINFVLAQLAAAGGMTWPALPLLAPTTLAVVHLTTLGWLTLLMLGALFQFVPVISNRPLPSQRLVLATLVLFECGLWTLVAGFIGFAGALGDLLPAGAVGVLVAIALGIANLLAPLSHAARRSLPARFVLAGLGSLIVTIALGVCFALALQVPSLAARLGPLLGAGLPAHLLAGLAGWLTLTAVGVSYKLLPMFLLAPEERGALAEAVFALLAGGTALAIAGAVSFALLHSSICGTIETAGVALAGVGTALYLGDVARIYRSRRRRAIELHNRAVLAAFLALGLLLPAALLWQVGADFATPLLVALALSGWLSGLAVTQLYKIVAFLSWLAHFGGKLGTATVPRVQDLVNESRGVLGFGLFFGGVAVQGAGAALAASGPFRVGTALCLLGTLALGWEYWRAWRLRYVAQA